MPATTSLPWEMAGSAKLVLDYLLETQDVRCRCTLLLPQRTLKVDSDGLPRRTLQVDSEGEAKAAHPSVEVDDRFERCTSLGRAT